MKTPIDICSDFPEWPERWMGVEKDIEYGQRLLDTFGEFIQHLINRGLARRTIRRHMDNLWALGCEIIYDVSCDEEYDIPPLKKLSESVGEDGGPYCRHIDSEAEQISFDATCRKLHKFLQQSQTDE